MSLQEKIYKNSPYFIKFLLLNVKGYLNYKQRYNDEYKGFLKEHIDIWDATVEKSIDFQKKKLSSLLIEVFSFSDWYSSKMKAKGITLQSIEENPFDVLKQMPVLSKNERRENVDLIVNKNRKTALVGHTSGTSGTPMIDYIDKESINISFAIWKRFHRVIGINDKIRQVRFSGRLIVETTSKKPPFWVFNYFEKQLLMSTYHLTDDNLPHFIKKLNSFKPVLLDGYPSAIYIISRFINKNNIQLSFIPKAIAVTAETLYDYQRSEIEKAFQCKVFNQYASSEGSPFITECTEGNLHLNIDSGFFEFINVEGKKAQPGEIAKLVVTSFINLKTPLIRYDIGDTVQLAEEGETCSCGCLMPIIKKLTGREDDILWTEEKGYVGRMDTAYKGLKGIIKSQLIQRETDKLTVKIVPDTNFTTAVEKELISNLQNRLGQSITIKIELVDDIPLGANGKFKTVIRSFTIDL
ncbi:hypothetical protein [uncultured Aquimarina sp.]|uniref:phenylacetate--CoA ligase family protein n=1 Tax=uncultured Aquimarina sp. TaxID=575652 RepID=UPI002636419B|nr:hypothetical protein [uncultured Aquimarina sp.]